VGSTFFSVVDTGGGVDVAVVVVVVVDVLLGPLAPPPHAAVIAPIAQIATAAARTGQRGLDCDDFMAADLSRRHVPLDFWVVHPSMHPGGNRRHPAQ
jgi:hypothetical protein